MSGVLTVRAARTQLALVLMDDHARWSEAEQELRRALAEPGGDPPAWRLHMHLSRLTPDGRAMLDELLEALVAAPPDAQPEVAAAAMALLDGADATALATGLAARRVRALVDLVQSGAAHHAAVRLAAYVSSLRGDVLPSAWLATAHDGAVDDVDPTVARAMGVARALELIDRGSHEQALALLDEHAPAVSEAAPAAVRALALYGLNRLEEALEVLARVPVTFDVAAARALIWLRQAAAVDSESRASAIMEADRAAGEAARREPTLGEGLLLRAQVTLEGTEDVDGGRHLLATAIRRLEGEPERARTWRIQRHVRDDDRFAYVALEVAAASGKRNELLAVQAADLPFHGTTWLQDGALAELIAQTWRDDQRPDEAATFFESAVQFYTQAEQPDRALRALQALAAIRPTSVRLLDLAEKHWAASFRHENLGRDHVAAAVREGLAVLDLLDADDSALDPRLRMHGAYLRGLLLARAADGGRAFSRRERWAPLPWLLLVALDSPEHSYRAAHLAWALDQAGLNWPAFHFARRAFGIEGDDRWIRETAIVMQINWFGELDEVTEALIEESEQEHWRDAVRAFTRLMRGDLPGLRMLVGGVAWDANWARRVQASALSRIEGAEAAKRLWRSVLDEALRDDPRNFVDASDAALALGDVAGAREHLEAGVANAATHGREARVRAAVIDLVDGRGGALEQAVELIGTLESPFYLRWLSSVHCPVLASTWQDDLAVVAQLKRLGDAATTRLEAVLRQPRPPLSVELDSDAEPLPDPALGELVRGLLEIEDVRVDDPAEAARRLAELAAAADGPLRQLVLAAAD